MIKLFDTHTHYDDEAYGADRDSVIAEMLGDNVAGFIAVGCSLERSAKASALSEKYNPVFAAVGIHPGDVDDLPNDYIDRLEKLCCNKKIVAIGEIGLDYYYDGFDREKQKRVFREQLELSEKLGLPVIIHSRDAAADTLEVIKKYRPRAVMHCFSGSAESASELVKLGIMLSFTGVLTFKNAKRAVEACDVVPLDMLMLETDCPYMAPTPFRGKRCDSRMARYIAEKIAEIKGISPDEAISICNENARRFFNIDF